VTDEPTYEGEHKTTGVGWSTSLSFEEALEAALQDLGWQPKFPDDQTTVVVRETGVQIGGIMGGRRLYMNVELQVAEAPPAQP
jgi:hypothetical protein